MTVIQKKRKREYMNASVDAGEDYGQKYHCDSCQKDITTNVRVRCAECADFDLCVECFSKGVALGDHKNNHPYRVMEILDFPIFEESWTVEEELALIEGCEIFGIGNWEDIATHIGTKTTKEVGRHYIETYVDSPYWPVPDVSREFDKATYRRGRRAPPVLDTKKTAKAKPISSVPANHEIQGYMPGRKEFEHEHENEAEQSVKDLIFEDADTQEERELKLAVLDIYNTVIDKREQRKSFIFERDLLDFRKIQANEKRRPKEEKDLLTRTRVFAKMQTARDFDVLVEGMLSEMKLRQRIVQLQEYRRMGIMTYKDAQEYEKERAQRASMNIRPLSGHYGNPRSRQRLDDAVTQSISPSRGATPASKHVSSFVATPSNLGPSASSSTPSTVPRRNNQPAAIDLSAHESFELLTPEEQTLCSNLRVVPKAYLQIKEAILREYHARGGNLRKRQARELAKIDVNKTSRIYDFFVEMGWISPPVTNRT
ncbi:hypothetical protein BJ742DRAFT_497143 [Cladochytrium replicatum]|nr:hypothetical protein BJ742DRAFT_497143 [Cladochytrium replicatum]